MKNIQINYEAVKKCTKKTLKIVRNAFIGTITVAIVAATTYIACVDISLGQIQFDNDEVSEIVSQYNDSPITILCLNDSQGLNLNPCFWLPSFPEYIAETLEKEGASVQFINASSLKFNKTNHIDKMLYENLSYKEIKILNELGAQSALSKVSTDIHSPIDFGFVGSLLADSVKDGDEDIYISTVLQESQNPIILYSSGANDLMRELNNNPLSISKYSDDGTINESYLYSVCKANDSDTLKRIMNQISNNFKNIYTLNPESQIYALSIYVPNSVMDESFIVEIIDEYNNQLQKICEEYGAHYISTAELAPIYMGNSSFHINEVGHKRLADFIIGEIASDCSSFDTCKLDNTIDIQRTDEGLNGLSNRLYNDIKSITLENYNSISNSYLMYVQQKVQKEIEGEVEIAKEALQKIHTLHR